MEIIPTVENGGLIKTDVVGIFKIGKKVSNEFNKFLVSSVFRLRGDTISFQTNLHYYNNMTNMMIISNNTEIIEYMRKILIENSNKNAITFYLNSMYFTDDLEFAADNERCFCGKNSLKWVMFGDKKYDFCSIKCQNDHKDNKDKLSKSLTKCDMNDVNVCYICYEYKKNCSLNCGHTFCSNCVNKWEKCPTCKQKITTINPIYL